MPPSLEQRAVVSRICRIETVSQTAESLPLLSWHAEARRLPGTPLGAANERRRGGPRLNTEAAGAERSFDFIAMVMDRR